MKTKNRSAASRGFTVVEIAIVLVVFGLLLGGVLKGSELVNSAKIRAIADRQSEMQKAVFLFAGHYGALPGDLRNASTYITNAANGDGDGLVLENESPLALQHLAASGFLRCGQCTETSTASSMRSSAANSPINKYGGVMSIWHDTAHYAFRQRNVRQTQPVRLQVHTGPRIRSDIMAELDHRLDDGIPNRGFLRFNGYDPTGAAGPVVSDCTDAVNSGSYRQAGGLQTRAIYWRLKRPANWPNIIVNCGGSFSAE